MVIAMYWRAGFTALAVLSLILLAAAEPVLINEPGRIESPGEYRLGNDIWITPGSEGLVLLAPDMSLDGGGYAIRGTGRLNTTLLIIGNTTPGSLPVTNVSVKDLYLEGGGTGVLMTRTTNVSVERCTIRNQTLGLVLQDTQVRLLNNHIVANAEAGMSISGATAGIIADNYLSNSANVVFSGDPTKAAVIWNLTRESGPSVTGGPYRGGNYWGSPGGDGFSDLATDCAGDGFAPYPFQVSGSSPDMIPLAGKSPETEAVRTVSLNWTPSGQTGETCYVSARITGNEGVILERDLWLLQNLTPGTPLSLPFEVPKNRSYQVFFEVKTVNMTPVEKFTKTFWAEAPPAGETGTIRYIDLEGGFYGIIGDDARTWYPIDLPREYARDGLAVRYILAPMPGTSTLTMWGLPARVLSIAPAPLVTSRKADPIMMQFVDPGLTLPGKTREGLMAELEELMLLLPGGRVNQSTDASYHVRVLVTTRPCAPGGIPDRYLDPVIAHNPPASITEGWLPLSRISELGGDPYVTEIRISAPPAL